MQDTISIVPSEVSVSELHAYLLGAVGPRPIAFASTMDEKGRPNLSPFSFFNVFGSNPPILIFSPARRVRDNSDKHTLKNVLKTREVVINIVDYAMVQQVSLASSEYEEGVNEFLKAGLSMQESDLVKPFRVAESPVQFECRVTKVEALGEGGGAGNLVFSEVVKIHLKEHILNKDGSIAPEKIDQVARMGGNWYCRARAGLFEVPKPLSTPGIGVDRIPGHLRHSKLLNGNNLGKLGNVAVLPTQEEISEFVAENDDIRAIISDGDEAGRFSKAQEYLSNNEVLSAWKVLLAKP